MSKTYIVVDNGSVEFTRNVLSAKTLESAKAEAIEYCCEGYDTTTENVFYEATIYETSKDEDVDVTEIETNDAYFTAMLDNGDLITTTTIDGVTNPPEPKCTDSDGHNWKQESVVGNGGGVVVHDECPKCEHVRVTDTWAQNRANGTAGYTTIGYETKETF